MYKQYLFVLMMLFTPREGRSLLVFLRYYLACVKLNIARNYTIEFNLILISNK